MWDRKKKDRIWEENFLELKKAPFNSEYQTKSNPTHRSYILVIVPEERSNIFPHQVLTETPASNSVTTQKTTIESIGNLIHTNTTPQHYSSFIFIFLGHVSVVPFDHHPVHDIQVHKWRSVL